MQYGAISFSYDFIPPTSLFYGGNRRLCVSVQAAWGAWEEKLFRIVVRSCYFSSISWVTGSELCLITRPLRMEGSRGRQGKWGGLTFFYLFLLLTLSVFFGMTVKRGDYVLSAASLISSLFFLTSLHRLPRACSPYLFILKPLIFIFFLPLIALMSFLSPILISFYFVLSLTFWLSPAPFYASHGSHRSVFGFLYLFFCLFPSVYLLLSTLCIHSA